MHHQPFEGLICFFVCLFVSFFMPSFTVSNSTPGFLIYKTWMIRKDFVKHLREKKDNVSATHATIIKRK